VRVEKEHVLDRADRSPGRRFEPLCGGARPERIRRREVRQSQGDVLDRAGDVPRLPQPARAAWELRQLRAGMFDDVQAPGRRIRARPHEAVPSLDRAAATRTSPACLPTSPR